MEAFYNFRYHFPEQIPANVMGRGDGDRPMSAMSEPSMTGIGKIEELGLGTQSGLAKGSRFIQTDWVIESYGCLSICGRLDESTTMDVKIYGVGYVWQDILGLTSYYTLGSRIL